MHQLLFLVKRLSSTVVWIVSILLTTTRYNTYHVVNAFSHYTSSLLHYHHYKCYCHNNIYATTDRCSSYHQLKLKAVPSSSQLSQSVTKPNSLIGPPAIINDLIISNHNNSNSNSNSSYSMDMQRPYYDPSFLDLTKPQEHTYTIKRLAKNAHVFLLQNFLTTFECEAIIHEALNNYNTKNDDKHDSENSFNTNEQTQGKKKIKNGMTSALSQDGNTQQTRSNCKVAWFGDSRMGNICKLIGDATTSALVTNEAQMSTNSFRSDMQVLHYEKNGKFVLHHDGHDRILTVIFYLNGVGETWFPLADVGVEECDEDDHNDKCGSLDDEKGSIDSLDEAVHYVHVNGLKPGKDGLLIFGSATKPENQSRIQLYGSRGNPHIVKVNPGDAVAFYSYREQPLSNMATNKSWIGIEDWRSIHAGLPVDHNGDEGKWLATYWFHTPSFINSK